jgi:hypothetical protein|tara:strand:+ start:2614 stop:2913 length:300 start_codon:yes stop_codon:yes gene_type:complete
MSKELVGETLYNKDYEKCDFFYKKGKSYCYNDCCIKFFIEKALIGKNKRLLDKVTGIVTINGKKHVYKNLTGGVIFCPSCSVMLDNEMLKVLTELTENE